MTEAEWLEVLFKLAIFDHALIALYLTFRVIQWIAPNWWKDSSR